MFRKFYLIFILPSLFVLLGCTSSQPKIEAGNINSLKLSTVSFTSLEVMLSIDLKNNMNSAINIDEVEITSKDIDKLKIILGSPLHLNPGKCKANLNFVINYSLDSVFSLLGLIQQGSRKEYTFLFKIQYSNGDCTRRKHVSFRKKFSQDELRTLIKKFRK